MTQVTELLTAERQLTDEEKKQLAKELSAVAADLATTQAELQATIAARDEVRSPILSGRIGPDANALHPRKSWGICHARTLAQSPETYGSAR